MDTWTLKRHRRRYLAEMCREIVQRYDVDGIHLDYIRYPETWKFRISKDQARGNITRIVEKIHQAVKKEKPWVKMSCSPIGKFDDLSRYWSHGWNAYTKVAQDAQAWLKDGLHGRALPYDVLQRRPVLPLRHRLERA